MKCPKCQTIVPDRSRCGACSFPFYAQLDEAKVLHLATHPDGKSIRLPSGRFISIPEDHNLVPMIMPLTHAQKNKHLLMALLFLVLIVITLMVIGYLSLAVDIGFIWVFVVIFGLALSWQMIAHLIDFFNGEAEVYVDRLIETERYCARYERRRIYYFGYFEQLGRVSISVNDHYAAIPGTLYRLSYAKASHHLLDVVQVDSR
ncbi:hypothetical protein [Herpetosiphon geysericola]|uniref:Uncharacterized protein n=1 Tax=Herpetosiphon geysericola TaxID=70996 RepID=A0A0P6XRN6_9CHLR|nr:hypothetical protein [Herpetosiphon geysericola]KPL81933.1 hypothetical protein SE18_20250 [Herpetosiphon geysericola]